MIITLEASNDELSSLTDDEAEDLFSRLLDADRMGRHIVVMNRRICEWGKQNTKLSGRNLSHLIDIKEAFATRGNISSYATCFLKVVLGNQPISIVDNCFMMGHKEFLQGEYASSKTMLIVENLNSDSKLYEFIFEKSITKTKVPGWAVEFILGGGNTTVTAFEGEIAKKRITVCVVDTDKISPCDKLGTTARKVLNRHSKRNLQQYDPATPYVGTAIETVGHELENYIPLSSVKYLDAFSCPTCLDDLVDQEVAKSSADCLWLYFDIKKGIDGKRLLDKERTNIKNRSVLEWICKNTKIKLEDLHSLKIPGIGSTIVDHFLKNDLAKEQYTRFTNTDYWEHLFLEHLEKLLWFLAAPKTLRS
ncbi:hypothetical protein TM1040_3579 (plasmid) [Ruegeria sp. TM1040]|uniref:hypothetical protein n=1 Tax=Ruegeria sp. (strain TM1040) TaxID=292414 RepID=UPI000055623F|nr:hypothetical protein [Ruegeria sp. TM1040]ABF62548.1 hypothetical protein TM1040_3579 [Ruegeria sp. TM1040]